MLTDEGTRMHTTSIHRQNQTNKKRKEPQRKDKMSKTEQGLNYLMDLRLFPLPGDDVYDFYGDENYINNCRSISEIKRSIRFLTVRKPDSYITATWKRIWTLKQSESASASASTSTPHPTSSGTEYAEFMKDSSFIATCKSITDLQRVLRFLTQSKPALIAAAQKRLAALENHGSSWEVRRQKEKFLMFTKILLWYLEQKDSRLYIDVKAVIKDCNDRNKRQEPGYESVTAAMKYPIKELVGDHYWHKATVYFEDYYRKHQGKKLARYVNSKVSGRNHQAQLVKLRE